MKSRQLLGFVGSTLLLVGCVADFGGEENDAYTNGNEDALSEMNAPVPERPHGAVAGDYLRRYRQADPTEEELNISESVCPDNITIPGIDVSYYQGTINWSQVKGSGIRFAIIRVSDGTGFLDPEFATNWQGAKAAGIAVGAYQFFRASQDAEGQADLMISQLQSVGYSRFDLPPVIDVETTDGQSSSTVANKVNAWLARIQSRLGTPMLYTSPGFWSGIGNPTPSPFPYLWDAHWTTSCPTIPPNWDTWQFWQYSSTGSVPGISGDVDLDKFNGGPFKMHLL